MRSLLSIAHVFAGTWLLCDVASALAHDLPISEMMLAADEDRLHLEIVLNASELNFFSELDLDKNGHLTPMELAERDEQVARQVVDRIEIYIDDQLVQADVAGIVPNYNTHHLTIRAHYPVDATSAKVEVSSRLAAITHATHLLQLTFQRPLATQKAGLTTRRAVAHFPALTPESSATAQISTANQDSPKEASQSWWKRLGLPFGLLLLFGTIPILFTINR